MEFCQECGRPLTTDEEPDLLCQACEWRVSGFPGPQSSLRGKAGQLIWRAVDQLGTLPGSDNRALAARLRECARLCMAAVTAIEEEEHG